MRRFDDKMNRQMSSLDASLLRRSWAITLTLANPSPKTPTLSLTLPPTLPPTLPATLPPTLPPTLTPTPNPQPHP